MEVEVLPPRHEPPLHAAGVHAPGWLGAVLALLTMTAAFSVGFLALFGRTLAAALVVWLAWPLLFSPQCTAWVFGAPRVIFWKILVLFLLVDVVMRLIFRRPLWPKK